MATGIASTTPARPTWPPARMVLPARPTRMAYMSFQAEGIWRQRERPGWTASEGAPRSGSTRRLIYVVFHRSSLRNIERLACNFLKDVVSEFAVDCRSAHAVVGFHIIHSFLRNSAPRDFSIIHSISLTQ